MCLIPIVQDKIYSGKGKESKVNCSCYCRWSGWQVKFIHAVKSPIFCPLSPRCTNDPIWSFAAPIITSFLVSVRKKWWWGGRLLEGRVFVEEQPLYRAACILFHGRKQCWHILNLCKRQLTGYLKISFLIESHVFRKHRFNQVLALLWCTPLQQPWFFKSWTAHVSNRSVFLQDCANKVNLFTSRTHLQGRQCFKLELRFTSS